MDEITKTLEDLRKIYSLLSEPLNAKYLLDNINRVIKKSYQLQDVLKTLSDRTLMSQCIQKVDLTEMVKNLTQFKNILNVLPDNQLKAEYISRIDIGKIEGAVDICREVSNDFIKEVKSAFKFIFEPVFSDKDLNALSTIDLS